jgi:hypothetical protein
MLKVLGALNILLAALMLFGVAMSLSGFPSAQEKFGRDAGDLYLLIFLCTYLAVGAVAGFCNGVISFKEREQEGGLPLVFHLSNGTFLTINLLLTGLVIWAWSRAGASADLEVIIIMLPLLVIASTYVFLLVRGGRSGTRPSLPTP